MQVNTDSTAVENKNVPNSNERTVNTNPQHVSTTLDSETPTEEFDSDNPPAKLISKEEIEKRKAEDKAYAESLNTRSPLPASGNPNATVADPYQAQVQPRYDIVQNRSDKYLVIPDLKTGEEDMGETLMPGDVIKLTDFYSPQQINRSKGLRYASTVLKGVNDNMALVPLRTEEEGDSFTVPEREKHAPGTTLVDTTQNDFDDRFDELRKKEEKREEKLKKKTLGLQKAKQHGTVNHV